MKLANVEIINNNRIGDRLYKLEFFSPYICKMASPGQFINIRCCGPGQIDPLLRRPFSIYDTDKKFNVATILYLVKGRGTANLSRLERGNMIDVCGPLGNPVQPTADKILLIAGGIGIAPIHFLAKHCIHSHKTVYLLAGFKDQNYMLVEKDIMRLSIDYSIYCEQNMWANRGVVTQGLHNLSRFQGYHIYCCGPVDMLKALQKKLAGAKNQVTALLEERMACGIGVCQGCVQKIKNGRDSYSYQKVCSQGPAFNLMEVLFE